MPYYNGRWHRYSEAERREYGRQQKEVLRKFWHQTWISKTGLKQEKNWTDSMIKSLLAGKEEKTGKITAYKRSTINRIEKTKRFTTLMTERVARQQKRTK
ncbi:hypothetical protein L2719_05900 [Shewanella schlegeliana]|uniref:Uncharacterized protein n=1 Tax=Shewanella schlegeliana TaxID=190308 RepID=A0ABS1SWU9_9GAMM|nr:hypothetical protein [Shewanella schlegeliana]MBL4912820.1 hypothetical protein [Shewanella schlegeliana]MCL1109083.1 hypothetical protein [Shewanella schlegeliana]GIU23085.1 hypothetical protein TUM4433_04900 [Shewanella schlegeliana]